MTRRLMLVTAVLRRIVRHAAPLAILLAILAAGIAAIALWRPLLEVAAMLWWAWPATATLLYFGVTLRTGRTPFYWAARLCDAAEVAQHTTLALLAPVARMWRAEFERRWAAMQPVEEA